MHKWCAALKAHQPAANSIRSCRLKPWIELLRILISSRGIWLLMIFIRGIRYQEPIRIKVHTSTLIIAPSYSRSRRMIPTIIIRCITPNWTIISIHSHSHEKERAVGARVSSRIMGRWFLRCLIWWQNVTTSRVKNEKTVRSPRVRLGMAKITIKMTFTFDNYLTY